MRITVGKFKTIRKLTRAPTSHNPSLEAGGSSFFLTNSPEKGNIMKPLKIEGSKMNYLFLMI